MAYLAAIHRPSSVRHALKLSFLDPDTETLVVAKANRLEFYAQTDDGLLLKHTRAIYGKVTLLNKLRPASATTDHLFVGTDRFMYFVLSWDAETKELITEKTYQDLADKSSRDTQTGDRCLIDPSGRFMSVEIYEGIINVVPIAVEGRKKQQVEPGTLLEPIQSRISELFVRSSAWLHRSRPKDPPQLALLYQTSRGDVRVKVRELDYTAGLRDEGSAEFKDAFAIEGQIGYGASHIIPLSGRILGFLVIGETFISYCDEFEHRLNTSPLDQATIFVAWEQIDELRFVLADEYGKLYLLMVVLDHKDEFVKWELDILGETSRASCLVYLDGGSVFVGSHQGDSQVIQIKEGSLEILQTFPNVAPILDFAVMDMGNRSSDAQVNEYSSGQARIVTGSGAFKDGSLRSVRSGVGLEDLGSIGEMQLVTDVFHILTNTRGYAADTLIVSFLTHTRVFHFSDDGDVEELDGLAGLDLSQQTLLAESLGGTILQVTPAGVNISRSNGPASNFQLLPQDGSVTAASTRGDKILLSASTSGLILLQYDDQSCNVVARRSFEESGQVACLTLNSFFPDVAFVGFWKDSAIHIISLDGLSTLRTEVVYDDSIVVPRSVLVAQIQAGSDPTLFVGMADGNVITYSANKKTYELSAKKSIILGTQQASFKALPRADGLQNVFAICEHPSLIYSSDGRIVYSAITAEDARCVCSFDAEAFPGAIAIATENEFKLVMVDEERTTHVQTLPVNETVRRIAYSAEFRAFGLGCIKRTVSNGEEIIESHFKLVDEVAFQELDTWPLNQDELVECCIRAKLPDGTGGQSERFIVGTSYLEDERSQDVRGRILVLEVTEDRHLALSSETAVRGACRCLAICEGKIVAALIRTLVMYSFEHTGSRSYLDKIAAYRTATAPIDMMVTGRTIALADLMKSMSVVEYRPGQGGLPDSLVEIGRHFETAWATAIAHVDDNTYLEADAEGNLMVLNQDLGGVSEEDRRRLRVTSEMLLGEMVNRIRRIDVQPTEGAAVIPRAFLATVEGSIYLFAIIAPHAQDLLMRLQQNMAEYVRSPGDVPFNRYRAFKNTVRESEEPMRFVDGELIERFLDCDTATQDRIVQGLGPGVEEIRLMVENLRRIH